MIVMTRFAFLSRPESHFRSVTLNTRPLASSSILSPTSGVPVMVVHPAFWGVLGVCEVIHG